jgi:hypothetical protein
MIHLNYLVIKMLHVVFVKRKKHCETLLRLVSVVFHVDHHILDVPHDF